MEYPAGAIEALRAAEKSGVVSEFSHPHDGDTFARCRRDVYLWLVQRSYALDSSRWPGVLKITSAGRDFLSSYDSGQYYTTIYLHETIEIAEGIDIEPITAALDLLRALRQRGGRLFILGNGGSAANASHAVNDFRKIARIEAYAPTDNVAELTAWANDKGWQYTFCHWLEESRLSARDMLLILSVGGGSAQTSRNLMEAMNVASARSCPILSIVSRDGGKAKELSDVCILIPVVNKDRVTPHAESWQSILLHLLINALGE